MTTPTQTPTWVKSDREPQTTAEWGGFIGFAGVMLALVGFFHAIAGLVAVVKESYYLVPNQDLLVTMNYDAWGWTHIAIGAVAVVIGLGLLWGKTWARWTGIGFAVISAIVNLGFLAAYPLWSAIVIAMDVLVIYALTVHGREMEPF